MPASQKKSQGAQNRGPAKKTAQKSGRLGAGKRGASNAATASKFARKKSESVGPPSQNSIEVARSKSGAPDRAFAFQSLRTLLQEFAPPFDVTADTPERFTLTSKGHVWRGGPMFFSEVKAGKVYVSLHLLPLYLEPSLQAVSAELEKRKQGKACFNFKKDLAPETLEELRRLMRLGIDLYNKKYPGWDKPVIASK